MFLHYRDLKNNRIYKIEGGAFQTVTTTYSILLSNNKLKEIQPYAFSDINVASIDLGGNTGIGNIPSYAFNDVSCQTFNLHESGVTGISANALNNFNVINLWVNYSLRIHFDVTNLWVNYSLREHFGSWRDDWVRIVHLSEAACLPVNCCVSQQIKLSIFLLPKEDILIISKQFKISAVIYDWLVFNANFRSISAISWREQMLDTEKLFSWC